MWVETSPWSFSTADLTPFFLACTCPMGMERQIRDQIHEQRVFNGGRSHSLPQSRAKGLTRAILDEFLQGIHQRVLRMVRRPGRIFLASCARGCDAAV